METTNTSEVALTNQEQSLLKQKSIAEKKFEAVISESAGIVRQCNSIVISDSTTLAMANQLLSKANSAYKIVEVKRKDAIRTSQEYIDYVNDLVKSKLTIPLKDAIEQGKAKLRIWNEAEVKRANDLKEEENKKYTFLKRCEENIKNQVSLADSPERCSKLIDVINDKWPTDEKFGQYAQEATTTKNNFIQLLNTKKIALEGALKNDLSAVTKAIEQINTATIEQSHIAEVMAEKKELINDGIQAEIGSVRKTWKFEVVDENMLPREFLSIDEKKVKAYLAVNKDNFDPNGTIKGGVKFFLDSAPMIK